VRVEVVFHGAHRRQLCGRQRRPGVDVGARDGGDRVGDDGAGCARLRRDVLAQVGKMPLGRRVAGGVRVESDAEQRIGDGDRERR
jgi:hypothetical protein